MKRLPLILNFILFALLCMVISFWAIQIFQPKLRPVVAPVIAESFDPAVGQWGSVFGQAPVVGIVPSNYQLKGVIVAHHARDSVAIIVTEGKPPMSIGIGKELASNVTLQEAHSDHIVVSEAGVTKRIDLPQSPPIEGVVRVVGTAPKNAQ